MRILTVDDDEVALEMLNLSLSEDGHDVVSATNGADALTILKEGGARLVITDWEMPGMSGLELCKAIRSDVLSGYVYVIMLTTHRQRKEMIDGMAAGADDFISKPYDPEELAVRLQAAERVLSLETRDVAIFAMAKLAESRDPETGAHLDRVRQFCGALARWFCGRRIPGYEIDHEFARTIFLTSPLHDIGKIGIPDSVLLKPGRLSDAEFEIMKTHTTLGAETLAAALKEFPQAKFLQMARDIAVSHHERYDGTGYPLGLVGQNIPLCGRIVAVADVYDALTSKRIYKNAFQHEVAKSIILEESQTHFDGQVIKAFLEIESEFVAIREHFSQELAMAAG